jgi:hypothetical protein
MSVLKQYNESTSEWEAVVIGKQGPSGTVAVTAPLTNTGTSTAAVLGFDYASAQDGKNILINGGFDIWQRGTTHAGQFNAASYTADRWVIFRSLAGNYTLSRQASDVPGMNYFARFQRTSGDTSVSNIYLIRTFESLQDVTPLQGKTITVSFSARKGANFSGDNLLAQIEFGGGTDTASLTQPSSATVTTPTYSLSASWQRYSTTVTVPSNATAARMFWHWLPTGTAGANDYFDIASVQVEIGAVATPFKRNAPSIQGELAACQRYYYRAGNPSTSNGMIASSGFTYNSSVASCFINFPVQMRAIPTSIDFSAPSTFRIWAGATGDFTPGVVSWGGETSTTVGYVGTNTSGLTSGQFAFIIQRGTGAFIGFNAEL